MPPRDNPPFWELKTLEEMNREEWESLCDGCALCCLQKLQDEETDEVFYTDIACQLLDRDSCRCTDYERRTERVRDCLVLSVDQPETFQWLPGTCAYRRLAQAQPLPSWHPLISGDSNSVIEAGISARHRIRVTDGDEDEASAVLFKLN